jgi:hypothetical protein
LRVQALRNPIRFGQKGCEALNRAVKDKFATFYFEALGVVVADYVFKRSKIGR